MPFVPDTQSGFVPDAPGFVPDEVSPYSAEGIAASRQALVQSEARRRELREEADAAALAPKVFVGVRKPFSDEIAAQFQVPESIAAFGAEAIKSSPSIAAGASAASASMPVANRLGALPGALGATARFGIPLVAGGAAAIGTRLAQDEVLPQILPEGAQQLYENTNELAARNPTAALLGQFAGSAPFFRPGLPINTTGGARIAVPAITGVVGGGIEGANQIASGEFDPTRLAAATLGSALMNRETALGQRIAPNLVLPNISARGVPDELGAITAARRDIPLPTDIVPDEFAAVQQARNQVIAERAPAQIDPAVQAAASDAKAQALAERMMGKDAPDQLAILEQELQLQKGTLTPAEQRAGLEMKQLLKQQIEQQQALEKAASDQQKAVKDAEKAQADAAKAAGDAQAAAAQPPKSAQILAESAKPPAIANVATEIGTQTSPFAVQGKINELTAVAPPPQQIAPEAAPQQIGVEASVKAPKKKAVTAASDRAEYDRLQAEMRKVAPLSPEYNALWQASEDIKNRNKGMPPGGTAGSGVTTPEIVSTAYSLKAPRPLAQSLGSVEEALAYRQERIDNYRNALKAEIGLDDAQAERLENLLSRDRDTGRFERTLTKPQRDKLEAFFDGPLNQKNGPLEQWDNTGVDLREVAEATDKEFLTDRIVGSLGRIGNAPEFAASDAFLSPVIALNRLREIGGSWRDVDLAIKNKLTSMRAGNDSAELYEAYGRGIKKFADDNGLSLPLEPAAGIAAKPVASALPEPPPRSAEQRLNEPPVIRQSPNYLNKVEPFSSQIKNGDYAFGVFFNGSSNEQAVGKVIRSSKDSVTIERPDGTKAKLSGSVGRFDGEGVAQAKAWFEYGQKNPEAVKAHPPRPGRETITPANDTPVGNNDAGEPLFDRADGSRYRMRYDSPNTKPDGYPDFGGDLVSVKAPGETAATPSPRSQEQRLNDADIGLPPVSGMKPAELIAELEAGGAKATPKGIPLADANSAQLKDAVGKMRRGQYVATSDIIETLQSKKRLPKRPKGEVASAGPDLIFDAAHDAALDVAILGIRAGRAIGEVIEMAVAKLRALNPKATDADIARLTKDITEAHGGRTTPVTEAEQIMADATTLEPTSGRAAEDTQQASRMRQTRGAISPQALTPLASAGAGGVLGFTETERRPGETDEEFRARRLRNTALGAAYGGAGGAAINALAIKGSKVVAERSAAARGKTVALPQISEGEGIRWNAEKAITNKAYPEAMREKLAADPEIIYDKISRTRLGEMTVGATDAELTAMLASADNNERVAALIEQANRAAVTPGMEAEAARLRKEVSKQFTVPAQLLGLGNLVRDPGAMVEAVEATLNASYAGGERTKRMTQAVKDNLFERARRNIQAEQRFAKARRAATENFNDATMAEFTAARKELGDSAKALADYSKDILPEGWGEMVSKAIKGNLLAPLSFAKNMFGNAMWQSMLRGAESIATGLDATYSTVLGRPRKLMLANPFPTAGEAKAFYDGVKLASKELLTGPSAESYVKAEVQRGFHPMRAMVQLFSGVPIAERIMERRGIASLPVNTETGRVSVNDRLKKLFEATLGITPEASFRMLNLGDKPVRLTSEARLLNEQANLQRLTGTAKQKAIALPSEATQALVDREGLSGIMAQKNMLAQRVGGLFDNWIVDITEGLGLGRPEAIKVLNKIVGAVQLPFRAFPANFAVNALNFAAPPIAMAKAAVQARNGNRREALRNIGEAVIGSMIYGAAAWLYENKLITPPLDMRDKKRRSAQYEMGASRINIDGIKRLQNGEDPSYRKGDETRDWSTMGPAAAPLYVYTARRAKGENKAARTGNEPEVPAMTGAMMDLSGAASFTFDQSFLSGTSAFIEAIKDWDNMGDRYIENVFRAVTAIPLPATLEAVSKMNQQFVPDMKGDSELQTLGNIWDFKTMQLPQDDRSNLKRDFWGEPIRRVPDGKNPYVHAFLDVTKAERQAKDPLKESLLEVYKKTNSTDVYPGLVTSQFSVSNNGTTTVDLNREDYDDLQQFVGAYRRRFAEQVTAMPEFSDRATLPEAKILALQEAYREGAKLGKALLLDKPGMRERYPELFGLPSGKESRVISRDPVARGRLRMELTPAK